MPSIKQLQAKYVKGRRQIIVAVDRLREIGETKLRKAKSTAGVRKLTAEAIRQADLVATGNLAVRHALSDLLYFREHELRTREAREAEKKAALDEQKARKNDEKRRCAEQVKGISKDDLKLLAKHKLLGRIDGVVQGPSFYTNVELKARLKQIKAEAKKIKVAKAAKPKKAKSLVKPNGAKSVFPFPGGADDKADQVPVPANQTPITLAPAAKAKIEAQATKKTAKKAAKAEKKPGKLSTKTVIAQFKKSEKAKKASKVDHDKMANTLDPGSAIGIMAARPSSHDLPMGSLQSDGGAY